MTNKSLCQITLLAIALLTWGDAACGFTPTTPMSVAHQGHSATLLPNGKVLVAGGFDGWTGLAECEIYDPASQSWSKTGALNFARMRHTATLLPDGKVLVVGGVMEDATSSVELYDPATGTWTPADSLHEARYQHTTTLLPNGKVLVTGGDGAGRSTRWLSSAEIYDPASGNWTWLPAMNFPRIAHTATLLPNGKVLAAGGSHDAFGTFPELAEIYDPATDDWTLTGVMREGRWFHTATLLENGTVLFCGGLNGNSPNTAELYDPATGIFTATGGPNDGRYSHTATLLESGSLKGQVFIAGGEGWPQGQMGGWQSAERYDPAAGIWIPSGSLNVIREWGFTATSLGAGGQILITGGYMWGGDWILTADGWENRDQIFSSAELVSVRDNIPPVVIITKPANNSVSITPNLVVSGKAKDPANSLNSGIQSVFYSLNGEAPRLATTANGFSDWSAAVTLNPGWNTFAVKGIDRSGSESALVTNTYYFKAVARLIVNTEGAGKVSLVGAGGSWDGHALNANLLLGVSYTITAAPAKNFVFSNWVNHLTGDIVESNVYQFTMQTNLHLTAVFSYNKAPGVYYGLFRDASAPAHHSSGFMQLVLNPNNSFSALMKIGGDTFPFSGRFSDRGRTQAVVPRQKQGKEPLLVDLDAFSMDDEIIGTVNSSGFSASVLLEGAASISSSNPVGKYTAIALHAGDAGTAPGGEGYAAIGVAPNGKIAAVGAMGDGTTFSQGVPVSTQGHWPLYAQFYPTKYVVTNATNSSLCYTNIGYNGSALGWISFSNNAPSGVVNWIKTGWTNNFYPNGFTNECPLLGSAYLPPPPGTRMVAITNGLSLLADGNLDADLINSISVQPNNVVTVSNNAQRLTVRLSPASGLFAGSFFNAAIQKTASLRGAVLQQQAVAGGWQLGTNQSGSVQLQPAQ